MSKNAFGIYDRGDQDKMTKKDKQTYPRSRNEMLEIMKAAD